MHQREHPEPVRTGSAEQALETWLTVDEAVLHCESRGLSRTKKTIRKWAQRSQENPENAEISVRKEDTIFGARWSIELSSLERKIDEELALEGKNQSEPVHTGAHQFEPVRTGSPQENLDEQGVHQREHPEPVRTGSDQVIEMYERIIAEKEKDHQKICDEKDARIQNLEQQNSAFLNTFNNFADGFKIASTKNHVNDALGTDDRTG